MEINGQKLHIIPKIENKKHVRKISTIVCLWQLLEGGAGGAVGELGEEVGGDWRRRGSSRASLFHFIF